MTTAFDRINTLEDTEIIAGESFTLYFNVTDENDTPINISTGTPSWVISPYGDPDYVALTKSGVITDTSQFSVELETADTQSLEGVYIQQPIYIDFNGKEFRKQGIITFVARIA